MFPPKLFLYLSKSIAHILIWPDSCVRKTCLHSVRMTRDVTSIPQSSLLTDRAVLIWIKIQIPWLSYMWVTGSWTWFRLKDIGNVLLKKNQEKNTLYRWEFRLENDAIGLCICCHLPQWVWLTIRHMYTINLSSPSAELLLLCNWVRSADGEDKLNSSFLTIGQHWSLMFFYSQRDVCSARSLCGAH